MDAYIGTSSMNPLNMTVDIIADIRETWTVAESVGDIWKNASKTETTMRFEKRVISMSLYGSYARYTRGAIENAKLVDKVFPGWKLRIYLPKTDRSRKDLVVPDNVIKQLKSLNVDLIFINFSTAVVKPMMWRFLVANDVTVDRFIVRDADSRLIPRDATEVERWIQSGKAFHCIRDHPGHSGWPISGGLWGGLVPYLKLILNQDTFRQKMENYGLHYTQDMVFLRDVVWPQVKHLAYCSDSASCDKWESSHPFTTNRSRKLEFVGEVIINGHRRHIDVDILRKTPVNPRCIPKSLDPVT